MLSRTADNLYWIARYMERADTAARLLEVGSRISAAALGAQGYRSEWDSLLQATGMARPLPRNTATRCSATSKAGCSSTATTPLGGLLLTAARENGRIVRTALTPGLGRAEHRLSGTAPAGTARRSSWNFAA
jgi:uncharacterized alpha-E superfamily protein